MHLSPTSLIAGLGLLAMAQAGPVAPVAGPEAGITFTVERTALGEIESFVNATALGVDIFGEIPDDGVREGDKVLAEPGSKAWAWIRAQIDIDWNNVPEEQKARAEKRQFWANIGVGMWTMDHCQGVAAYWDNAQYGLHHWDDMNFYSIGIYHRDLRNSEQLDVSRWANGDWCGRYMGTIGGEGIGCAHVGPINCFHLFLK
ncbi:hypothetical protein ACRALDRAFT_1072726 [Sodiomyces alcalophilus JCM 7366]|uniref:uncharacterized protein n=1 Tax=Sodiomyces alcalophilus JCM 7366 TaxID=591952 RepID=UPI0039B42130